MENCTVTPFDPAAGLPASLSVAFNACVMRGVDAGAEQHRRRLVSGMHSNHGHFVLHDLPDPEAEVSGA